MPNWLKVLGKIGLGLALVLGFLYGWLTSNAMKKPAFYAHSVAANIASGRLRADEGYDYDKAQKRLGDASSCTGAKAQLEGLPAPYFLCIAIRGNDYVGCGTWSDGSTCVSLWADTFLLNEPERLGGVIDAMAHPCRYLPSPEKINTNQIIAANDRKFLNEMWREALCDTHPDQFPGRVILTFFDGPREAFRLIKP